MDHRTIYKIGVIADPDQASVRDGTKKLFSELLTGQDFSNPRIHGPALLVLVLWYPSLGRTVSSEARSILNRDLEFTRRQRRSNFWKRLNRTWIWLLILWSWNGIIRWGFHQKLSYKTFSIHRKFNFNTFNVHLKKPFSRYSNLWWLSYHGRW